MSGHTLTLLRNRTPEEVEYFRESNLLGQMLLLAQKIWGGPDWQAGCAVFAFSS